MKIRKIFYKNTNIRNAQIFLSEKALKISNEFDSRDIEEFREKIDEIRESILKEKSKLLEQKRKSFRQFTYVVGIISGLLISVTIAPTVFSTIVFVVETATLALILILIVQFDSLRREIKSIFSEPHTSSRRRFKRPFFFRLHINKIYDVKKNTLDKLFDKLETFSKTWLGVSGGIGSTFLIEIFRKRVVDISSLALILCSILIWGIAQDLYGILNYELAARTKDLELFYLELALPF